MNQQEDRAARKAAEGMKKRVWRAVAVVLLLGTGVIAMVIHERVPNDANGNWLSCFRVSLSGGETIEYGWIVGEYVDTPVWAGPSGYMACLIWHRRGEDRWFMIHDGGDPMDAELRATDDRRKLWLVSSHGDVVGTLDRDSGECLNTNGIPMDWRLAPSEQARVEGAWVDKQKPYPSWATQIGGTVIAHPRVKGPWRETAFRGMLHQLRSSIGLFQAHTGCYPQHLEDLTRRTDDPPEQGVSQDGETPVDIEPTDWQGPYLSTPDGNLPVDPITGAVDWDYVNAGPDVGDVHSAAEGTDLDGTPFSTW